MIIIRIIRMNKEIIYIEIIASYMIILVYRMSRYNI